MAGLARLFNTDIPYAPVVSGPQTGGGLQGQPCFARSADAGKRNHAHSGEGGRNSAFRIRQNHRAQERYNILQLLLPAKEAGYDCRQRSACFCRCAGRISLRSRSRILGVIALLARQARALGIWQTGKPRRALPCKLNSWRGGLRTQLLLQYPLKLLKLPHGHSRPPLRTIKAHKASMPLFPEWIGNHGPAATVDGAIIILLLGVAAHKPAQGPEIHIIEACSFWNNPLFVPARHQIASIKLYCLLKKVQTIVAIVLFGAALFSANGRFEFVYIGGKGLGVERYLEPIGTEDGVGRNAGGLQLLAQRAEGNPETVACGIRLYIGPKSIGYGVTKLRPAPVNRKVGEQRTVFCGFKPGYCASRL